jgi:hypothetical protein
VTTAFEELPPAIDTPISDGRVRWHAYFRGTTLDGTSEPAYVTAVVHPDKASELRLKQERRGHLMCGMLVDATGMVYGISSVYVDGPAETTDDDVAALSQIDVARARLIDLASAWRRTGLDLVGSGVRSGRAELYARCAQQLDEIVVELLSSGEEMDLDVDDVEDGRDG